MRLLGRKGNVNPDEIRMQALAWVNKHRRVHNRHELLDFPKGVPNTTLKCPVSLAVEDIYGAGLVLTSAAYLRHASDQRIITKLPEYVTIFVGIFDDRGYLDLVDDTPPTGNRHYLYVPDKWVESYYITGRCA